MEQQRCSQRRTATSRIAHRGTPYVGGQRPHCEKLPILLEDLMSMDGTDLCRDGSKMLAESAPAVWGVVASWGREGCRWRWLRSTRRTQLTHDTEQVHSQKCGGGLGERIFGLAVWLRGRHRGTTTGQQWDNGEGRSRGRRAAWRASASGRLLARTGVGNKTAARVEASPSGGGAVRSLAQIAVECAGRVRRRGRMQIAQPTNWACFPPMGGQRSRNSSRKSYERRAGGLAGWRAGGLLRGSTRAVACCRETAALERTKHSRCTHEASAREMPNMPCAAALALAHRAVPLSVGAVLLNFGCSKLLPRPGVAANALAMDSGDATLRQLT